MEAESRVEDVQVVSPELPVPEAEPGAGEVYVFPASFAQQRLWFLDRLEPGSPAYNLYNAVRLVGDLRVDVLVRTMEEIVARHETLRTSFATMQGEPVQVISPAAEVRMPLLDLAGLPDGRRHAELAALSAAEARHPFDLARGPLLRVTLVRLAGTEHAVLFNLHHIVGDGWSMGVLVREVAALYAAFAQGEPSPLPDLPIQYADFAQAQREWLQGEVLAEQIAYWQQQLAGLEPLDLPTDHPRPAVRSVRGGVRNLLLPAEAVGPVTDLARQRGTTLFVALLAALQTLLHRWTGGDDVAVGTVVAGRSHLDSEGMIGFFVNTLVMRTDLSGEPSFDELLVRAHAVAVGAFVHQDLPFERLVEELQPQRDLARSPFFDVLLVLQNTPSRSFELPGLTLLAAPGGGGTALFDWTVNAVEAEGALLLSLEHSADLFESPTAQRALSHLGSLLRAAGADPDRRLSDLPLLTSAERAQLLQEWNDTARARLGGRFLHGLVAERSAQAPDAVAVTFEGESLTWGGLQLQAGRLARRLRALGCGPEVRVGVAMERSPELVVALLGTLAAGAAYVPLDPDQPRERLALMTEDAGPAVIVAQERLLSRLPETPIPVVFLDGPLAPEDPEDSEPLAAVDGAVRGSDLQLAYVIFTSGSTGRPKASMLHHRGIVNRLLWMREAYGVGPSDVVLQKTPFGFDVSVWELFVPLITGARMVMARPGGHRESSYQVELVEREGVSVLHFVPSMLRLFLDEPDLSSCASVRLVVASGEALSPDLARRFRERLAGPALENLYGPTEASVEVTAWSCGEDVTAVPIGRPIANAGIHLVDRGWQPVPIGVPGELWIAGVPVARGYLGRPDLTAERFVPNPFSLAQGARAYRSGDLARHRADGAVEFLGRVDQQVKIRGFRVEPGEVEAALLEHPAVGQAAVVARSGAGGASLVAYVAPRAGVDGLTEPSVLRSFLRRRLPEPMVPARFVRLEALPLNASGKLDRRALPEIASEGGEAGTAATGDPVPPRDPVEEGIVAIWRDVLGIDRLGVHDVFFELGGHSLSATRVVSRVRAAFGIDLPLRALFEAPTVAGVGERVRAALRHGAGVMAPPLVAGPAETGRAPLSFAQQRLWFLHRLEPESTVYNLRTGIRLPDDLDLGVLARSLGEVVRRHATLRTRFAEADGEPVQVIEPAVPPAAFVLPLADLAGLGAGARAEAQRLAEELGHRTFDLALEPPVRWLALRLPGDSGGAPGFALLAVMHHVVSDAWSMGILARELSALYAAFRRGISSPLPPLPVHYADFARWQRRWLAGDVLAGELAWWRERLAGLPVRLDLPADRPRPPVQSQRGAIRDLWIAPELGARVAALALREGATPFMVLLTAYQGLLARWSGQDDFAVGTPIAGRTRVEVEELIGFFINNLVLRASLSGEPSFREVLGKVRSATLDAYAHQDLPFEKLVEELAPERSLAHSPIFQVVFGLQTAPTGAPETPEATGAPGAAGGASAAGDSPLELASRTAKYDLLLSLFHEGEGFAGLAEYSTDLFDATTVDRFLGHFRILLAAVLDDPGRRLADIPLLTGAERHQTLVEWSGSVTPYPREATVQALFEEQADRRPDAVAVVASTGGAVAALTYGELEARANRLAHHLRAWGVGPEVLVGLCLERSADLLVGILGILKAGGAYVPLDPSYPLDRLAWLLDNNFMPVVVAEERTADRLPAGPLTRLVLLDGDAEALAAESGVRPDPAILPDNLVYVLFTSGSTGEPKGVAAVHRGVVRLVRETGYARFGAGEVFLQLAPVSFDASTLEIWGPLLNGGRLVVPPPGTVSLAELGALLADHGVTTLWLTAGLFHEMADAHLAGLAPVRQLLAGGDVLSPVHAGRVLRELPGLRLINGYGPTENTTFTCCYPMADPAGVGRSVAIGRPIANTSVHLLDRRGLPVPLGVHGELAAGGDGLARGYLDRPDLTAERWRPDAASGLAGGRLYHTGDLARLLPDGRVEFLGRIDQQVKIRGFRIEPGEIEAALARHPAVRESAVVAREDRPGDRRLVAYVVTDPESQDGGGERELRSYLAERLPAHMVPAHVVFLEALPLTANGKVDRRALPAPGSEGGGVAGFVAPTGEVEEELASIWSEVLARSPIGAQDNFFELGGHSLLAVRVISQVRDRFGVELPLRTLFEESTVAGMARSLREAGSRGTAAAPEAPPLRALLRNLRPGHEEVFPLSFAQQRLWFLDRLEPGSPLYNMPLVLRLDGELEVDVLERALARIVQRHESLRTTFRIGTGGSEPVQVVAPTRGFTLPVIDLAADFSAAGAALPGEVHRLVTEEALRPFDLERGPLFRPRLLRLGAEDHVMLASMHHIVSDGWSLSVLVRELVTLYGAFRDDAPSPLPELPVQYADYAVWQRGWLSGEVLEAELDWWRERLAGLPPLLDLPTDRPRPPVQAYAGTSLPVRLEAGTASSLSALAVESGATLFMAVLALFQSLLSRWARQEDFALGSPVAGRNRSELEGLVGFFVNTLVLRADLASRPGFHQLLERTRQRTLEVYAHQEVPFEKLVEEVRPQRSLAHPPLFQVVFALQNMPRGGFELPGLRLTSMGWGENRTAKFDLTLFLTEMEDGLAGTLEYNTDLFDAATVDRLGGHLQRLAAAALAAPETPVAELSFLSAEEKAQLLVEWNATRRDYPRDRLLPELFAEQVARRPDAVALVTGDERVTYAGLELRTARLARQLRELGVGPDVPVALFAERSLSTITGLLAISMAGGAYVPLDPQHPAERLAFLLDDARPAAVLTEVELIGRLPAQTAHVVPLEGSGEDGSPLRGPLATPGSLACVLYTSGSTGRPKGVAVTHRNVARLVRGGGFADLGPDQVFLQLAPLAFDASTLEVWGALANGGQLVIPAAGPVSLQSLAETLEHHGVTTLWLTAGLFHQMVDEHPEGLRPVRQLLAGGDVLSPTHVRRALAALPESVLINGYGPTENTTFTCCHVLRRGESLEPSVPIGQPIGNTRVYLLDEEMAPVPAGVRGELFAGGDGVARGYFGQPALTAERFVPDPFDAEGGGRLYRTGDLSRWRPDGILEFLGRIDQQVKLRGFRVEPGEVEAVLAEHPAVRQAAVLVRRDGGGEGEKRLVGYVAGRVEAPELRRHLERLLPSYMVPAGLVMLEELPLNASGKVDRLALSRLAAETADAGLFVAPRGPLEEMVAAVWSEVLGRERIGAQDDFFALGGHSLLATRVISRVRSVFGVDLPVASLFEAPTPAGLAARIAAGLAAGGATGEGATAPSIVPVPREGRPPLSFAQERLWFLDQLEPGLATYNMPFSVRLTGAFDLAALAAGLAEVMRRHEALRTTFPAFEGAPWQRVAPFSPPPLPAVDLRGLPRERRAAETRAWLAREATRPFDLARGPLLRPLAFLTAGDELVLFLALHHTVSDGWSMGILEAELGALYAAFSHRLPSPLPELPVQYADFAVWQRRWLTGEVLERQLDYWRRTLAGAPALLELPADRLRPPAQSFRGATLPFALPAELARALQALARRHGATLFMTALAAFQALLHRATGQDVIPVGTPVANRHHQEIEGLIGFFVNTLVLPADLGDDPPFTELLARVRQTSLAAHAHQDLPFEKLVEVLAPERSLGHSPLFQVMLTFQNLPFQGPATVPAGSLAGLATSGVETSLGIAKFDLDLALLETEGGLDGSLTYAADLFDEATAVRLLQQLETLLSAVTTRPEVHPSELLLLSEAQRQQLLLEWSGREIVTPVRCLHHFVEAQADRSPEAVAIRFGGDLLTYGALEEQANRLARLLRRHGVGPEVPVAVFMDRSLEMVVALLGVLKAGGAYVPLDPAYPRERLAFMLEDCQAPVLLSQDWLVERLPEESSSRRITLDPSFEILEDEEDERPEVSNPPVTPANLAYVIYTSGSTGRPKGVAITHGSAAALLEWAAGVFGEGELAGTLASTSICFDLSVFELFVPLSRGGCVLLVESALELLEIGGEVGGQPVTLINTVPSAAAELVRAAGLPASVRTVNLAGEPIPPALAAQLHAQPGVRRLLNLYGPSEDTTYSTLETVLPQLSPTAAPPAIGRPLAGTRAYVLDGALQPVPPGMPGELYLGGAGLARGYFRRPDLTAERFVPDLFATPAGGAGRRLYRTGDRVRHLADGRLDFLGRIDHQVKLRGYRMELGEIEAALSLHPGVRQAVAGVRESGRDRRLVAWFVPADPAGEGTAPGIQDLRAFLAERLPHYMVPSALVALAALPLTPTGKIDRRALPDPGMDSGLAPRDVTELELARLWEEVLGVGPVGVRDDFFQLGGHSLLAVRLMSLVRERFGRDLPLASLFRAPTIERLALLLRQEGESGERQALVEITPPRPLPAGAGAAARPFFCVHPAGGNVLCYLDLARALGPDQPFYGLQLPATPALRSVEEMAAHYLEAIRAVQPAGPYFLGGWSIGGIVAFEMAQQLTAAGEAVALLAVIDSILAIYGDDSVESDELAMISLFAQDLAFTYGREFVVSLSVAELRSLDPAHRLQRVFAAAQESHLLPPGISSAEAEHLFAMYRTTRKAMAAYVPRPYPGPVVSFFASEGADRDGEDESSTAGWENVADGGVEVEKIAGDHYSILRPPMVSEVAVCLAARIQALGGSEPR